nr:synaptobrevin, longin-like domain protein [Tanacetum cinerariifolium]
MVAILEKGKHDTNFHPMVDFLKASPLGYALTVKPTVYVFHLRQFWSTARIETMKEGTKILVTVDGIVRTVSESSLRKNLKLRDEVGISSLPDAKLFENLTLMGYNISPNQKFTFQKGQFSHQWKYLIHAIMQCLSPKSTWFNEFSSNIATALVCLATNRTYNFSKMIFDGLVKNVNNKGEGSGTPTEPHQTPSPEAQTPSHTTHPSLSLPPITTTSIPTVTPTETTPIRQYTRKIRITQSSVPPTVADKPASPQRDVSQEEACLTDSGFIAGQDRATIDKSSTLPHDSAPWVTSPAAIKGIDVPTSSGSIPTASTPAEGSVPTGSDEVPNASLVFATATVVTPVIRRKGKEVMVKSETPKKQKVQEQIDAQVARELEEQLEKEDQKRAEQITRDAEIVRIYAEEELQSMIDGLDSNNETIAKYLEEYRWKVKDFRGVTFEEVEAKFNSVCKQMEDFIPMGSKEEAERIKRKGINLEQESAKKQKSSEEITEEAKSLKEVTREKVKEMLHLVLIEERSYWKITRLGGSSACYQFFIDLLKHLDREDLNQLWILVKETLSTRPPISDKEIELWVELSRLYEPDEADQLQRQRNLYACGE